MAPWAASPYQTQRYSGKGKKEGKGVQRPWLKQNQPHHQNAQVPPASHAWTPQRIAPPARPATLQVRAPRGPQAIQRPQPPKDEPDDLAVGDMEAQQEEEADWGCEEDESVVDHGDFAENRNDAAEQDEGQGHDVDQHAGLHEPGEDVQKEGALPQVDELDGPFPSARCLGVLKMHNPQRDFGFISPLLSIPEGVPLAKGTEGLWFFGAPMLQAKGPLVGREVRFTVCTGKDRQRKTQAEDVVLADEEPEIKNPKVGKAEPIRTNIKQELDDEEREHSLGGLLREPTKPNVKQEVAASVIPDVSDGLHATGREPPRPYVNQERAATVNPRVAGNEPARPKIKQELAEAEAGAEIETGLSDVAHTGSARNPLQYRERFSAKAVKGETWSSDVGFTRIKIEYQEPAGAMMQNGERDMAGSSSAGSSAAYKSAEAAQDSAEVHPASGKLDAAVKQEADGMQRLRSLVEEGPYYKCFPCKAAMKGQCFAGNACPDAHTLQEVRALPDTKMVRKVAKRSNPLLMQSMLPMPLGTMWGMPSMGMGMTPFGVPPMGAFPPYLEPKRKKKKKRAKYSD